MTNKLTFIIFFFLIWIDSNAQSIVDNILFAEIKFEKEILTFDEIKEGENAECNFVFTNTGSVDLIITKIKGSCGCVIPSNWSKKPIKPGKKSSFHVKIETENIFGMVEKSIAIFCNIENKFTRVKIKGYVEEDLERRKRREEFIKNN